MTRPTACPRAILAVLGLVAVLAVAAGVLGASPAFAEETPWWRLSSSTRPTHLQPGSEATIVVQAVNLGDAAVNATEDPVTIADKLPPHVTATAISGIYGYLQSEGSCSLSELTCTMAGPEPLQPYEHIEVTISVKVDPEAQSGADNEISITGGQTYRCNEVEGTGRFTSDFCKVGAEGSIAEVASPPGTGDFEGEIGAIVPGRSLERSLVIENGPTPFGIEDFGLALENEGGSPDTQAGSRPFQFTTTLALNQTALPSRPPALAKDVRVNLPPGLIGNPTVLPQCTEAEFSTYVETSNLCPSSTVVGVAVVTIEFTGAVAFTNMPRTRVVPVFNLVPEPGEPARFGFEAERVPVTIDTSVRTGGDYGIVASTDDISQAASFLSSAVTLWGVPGDPRHDRSRGWSCVESGIHRPESLPRCAAVGKLQPQPFLTLPTSCTGEELETSAETDSWEDPNPVPSLVYRPKQFGEPTESLDGCNRLPFSAEIGVVPDVQSASTPAGLMVNVHVPSETRLNPAGISSADVKDTTVTLPEGVVLNSAGAGGLEACSDAEIGFEDFTELDQVSEPGVKTAAFTPTLPEPLEPGSDLGALGFCPNASKIGTVSITTPILAHPLKGAVYLAAQNANPFGSLIAMYIVAEERNSGVLVKLPGEVSLNQETGQIVSTFLNTPQTPFEDLELHFFGGERASLATPSHCGTYTTSSSFTPWSGNAPVNPSSKFEITSGPNGGPCPGSSLPFAPSLVSGTTSNQAGAFSPLTTTISREDGNQDIQAVTVRMPPGLSGLLSGVTLCGEAQAEEGLCGSESLIGETTVSVGLGGDPYTVTGGRVYITGPYEGAPFGLSIVSPAKGGPFDLAKNTPCDCVVVRAKIAIDPYTAQLTITTDGKSEAHPVPHILDGIPLEVKHVNVTINRPGFTFNPTNCSKLGSTGTLTSTEEAVRSLLVPFQVTNCAALGFAPKFAVSSAGKTSKTEGASLTAKLTYPSAPQGTQANIAKAKFDLPKQLPSRLTTLHKACLATVFEANPANCPAESVVGHAKVTTPVLPVPLTGPAYFVSHGGEAFPSLTMVLQGYGVTIDLVGTTFIKAGITSATFNAAPDAPFNILELTLPQGKDSALAANRNLCKTKLVMPTAFVAQNGAEIHESTPIAVSGCPNTISISSHRVKGKTSTIGVSVPAAGRLTASGKGVGSSSKTSSGRETVSLTLSQKKAGKLKTKIKLSFTPSKGAKQSKNLTVEFKR